MRSTILTDILFDKLGGEHVRFDHTMLDFLCNKEACARGGMLAVFQSRNSGQRLGIPTDALLGADGLRSRVSCPRHPPADLFPLIRKLPGRERRCSPLMIMGSPLLP